MASAAMVPAFALVAIGDRDAIRFALVASVHPAATTAHAEQTMAFVFVMQLTAPDFGTERTAAPVLPPTHRRTATCLAQRATMPYAMAVALAGTVTARHVTPCGMMNLR